jgi:cellulose biosynthesis protein BcsQ
MCQCASPDVQGTRIEVHLIIRRHESPQSPEAFEVVIIDTPPKNTDVAIEAAKVSDLINIPYRPQIDDIDTLLICLQWERRSSTSPPNWPLRSAG